MDTAALLRMRSNISKLFSVNDDLNADQESTESVVESSEDSVPSSLLDLPTFSLLKKLSDKKEEVATLENELHLKPFLKGFDQVQSLMNDGLELYTRLAMCLEFMQNSSQILLQALKDPMAEDALPLPHHLHSKAIQTIEDCIWMTKHRGWQPLAYEVEWGALLSKLQQEVDTITSSSKNHDKHLKEAEDLKQKLNLFIEGLPPLKRV